MNNINNINNINDLIENINANINKCANLQDLDKILHNYSGDDWKKYIMKDYTNYYKNLVYKNDDFEIFIITWHANAQTKIHDHPDKGCLVKVLEGSLIENEYYYDKENDIVNLIKINILHKNDISFKVNNEVLHRISNKTNNICVSLHVYSKPGFLLTYY